MDVLETPATLVGNKGIASKERLKLTSERVVIALLLQKPELAEVVEELEPKWSELSFLSKGLLLNILGVIERKRIKTTAVLSEEYRDTDNERDVSWLANLEVMPRENDEFDEDEAFRLALENVIDKGRKQYEYELMMQGINK